ncbi:MAG: hypothetical protein ACREKM_09775 [Longimicrobiales bacterium]
MRSTTLRPVVLLLLAVAACAAQNRMGDVQYWPSSPPARLQPLYNTLEDLVREQTAFYRANGFYHESVTELDVTTQEGTTVRAEASNNGWSAVARSPGGAECAVFIGQVRTIPTALGVPVARENRILCAQRAPRAP